MAYLKNSLTYEESVERFANYMVRQLEEMKKKEDDYYNQVIEDKMDELGEFWSKELDKEEKESLPESFKNTTNLDQQQSESPRKMTRPTKLDLRLYALC